jgi:hypothetical protein
MLERTASQLAWKPLMVGAKVTGVSVSKFRTTCVEDGDHHYEWYYHFPDGSCAGIDSRCHQVWIVRHLATPTQDTQS